MKSEVVDKVMHIMFTQSQNPEMKSNELYYVDFFLIYPNIYIHILIIFLFNRHIVSLTGSNPFRATKTYQPLQLRFVSRTFYLKNINISNKVGIINIYVAS